MKIQAGRSPSKIAKFTIVTLLAQTLFVSLPAAAYTDITGIQEPTMLAITPDGTKVYVASSISENVRVITVASDTVTASISDFSQSYGLAITPSGTEAYVTDAGNGNVRRITIATNTIVGSPISVSNPQGITILPDGTKAYVARTGNVSVINTTSNTIVATVATGGCPNQLASTPDSSKVYVVDACNDQVYVINTASNTVSGGPISVGDAPQYVAVTPDGTKAYVASYNGDSVSVINTTSNTVTSTITGIETAVGVAFNAAGTYGYVTSGDEAAVYVIDTSTDSIVGDPIPVGVGPGALAITPDGTKGYTANSGSDSVSVFDPTPIIAGPPSNDSTIDNNITMTRMKAGAPATMAIEFTLQNTLSSTLTVTFPAGFTITSVPGTGSSGCLSNFDFSGQEATADKDSCSGTIVFAGINVTNPVTPGLYMISWVNDDPGEGGVAIVDDDQVTVTANIDATITFDIDTAVADSDTDGPYSVALGSVSASSVRVSGSTDSVSSVWLELSTNATAGAVVTIRNANGASGLVSASEPSDAIANAAGAMSAGTEKYGLCVAAVTAGVGTLSKAGDYASGTCAANSETNDVENLTTSAANIVSTAAPVSAAQAQVLVQATVSSTTEAHNDYADTLTFIATGTF